MPGSVSARAQSCRSARRQLSIASAARRGNRSAERAFPRVATPATPSTLKLVRDKVVSRPGLNAGFLGDAEEVCTCKPSAKAERFVVGGLKACPRKSRTRKLGKLRGAKEGGGGWMGAGAKGGEKTSKV